MTIEPMQGITMPDVMTEPTTQAIQRLEMEARAMETAVKIAHGLSRTQMVPEHFRVGNGGDAAMYNLAAAILYGAELGLSAVQSAQNVFVVRGKPAVYSRTMAAQVRRAGYVLEEVEASAEKVVWKAERDGTWAISEWTIERAQQAGYTNNKLYNTNPIEMLRAKCIAEVCRIKYQDVLLGMAYSVEELQLLDGAVVTRPVKKSASSKGVNRLREAAAESAPERKSEPAAPERKDLPKPEQPTKPPRPTEDEPTPQAPAGDELFDVKPEGSVTTAKLAKIRGMYKAQGVSGDQNMLDDINQFLQAEDTPPLTALKHLSAVDAEAVIKGLEKGNA